MMGNKSVGLLCLNKILCQFGPQLLRFVAGAKGMTVTHQDDEFALAPHPIDMLERTARGGPKANVVWQAAADF